MSQESNYSRIGAVSIKELKEQMHIIEYNGFSSKYHQMNEETCEWLKLNFGGTQTVVKRKDHEINIPVTEIQQGDILVKLNKFPEKLRKLTKVNQKLIAEFEQHGFKKFLVLKSVKNCTLSQEKQFKALDKANFLVSKVKESARLREEAAFAVENLFDNARNGKINTKEIKQYAEKIIASEATEAMTAILSLKESDQTYTHCIDVGAIFYSVYIESIKRNNRQSIFKNKHEILVAAFLHDIGKSRIPKDLLDSPTRYEPDSKEMKLIRAHPTQSAKLLTMMRQPDYIVNMAHYHHVKFQSGLRSSYPPAIKYDQLLSETVLLSIVDIFQALVGKRLYKNKWIPPAAMRYLDTLSDVEFDGNSWDEFVDIIGLYPVGSLLKLSDDSTAFVIGVSETDPSRPKVAVIRNKDGHDMKRHTFLDLEEIKDISISDELDPIKVLGANRLSVFENINLVA